QRTEALRAAIELDLFTHVAAGRRSPEEIADACRASPRGVRILADYLTVLGLLRKAGDRYELIPNCIESLLFELPSPSEADDRLNEFRVIRQVSQPDPKDRPQPVDPADRPVRHRLTHQRPERFDRL